MCQPRSPKLRALILSNRSGPSRTPNSPSNKHGCLTFPLYMFQVFLTCLVTLLTRVFLSENPVLIIHYLSTLRQHILIP